MWSTVATAAAQDEDEHEDDKVQSLDNHRSVYGYAISILMHMIDHFKSSLSFACTTLRFMELCM